jgi:16S rRNA processing protein RimM
VKPRYVPLACVTRPHGIQGELRVKVYNEDSTLLLERPTIRLRLPNGDERDLEIVSARPTNKALLIRLPGVLDCNAAEALRGAELCVLREAFPELDEGEFYACDVEGARVVLGDEPIGTVVELRSYPTCEVLVVARGEGGGTLEVPLVDAYVASVTPAEGLVRLVTIDGLS